MYDKKELDILVQLRNDSRMQLSKMSRTIGVPISTIHDRIKHNRTRLRQKNVALIDFNKLGFGCRVTMALKLKKKERTELKDYLSKFMCVNSLYKINNGYDFMVDAIFENVKEVEEFKEKLEEKFSLAEVKTYYIIEEILRENFLSNPLHVGVLMSKHL